MPVKSLARIALTIGGKFKLETRGWSTYVVGYLTQTFNFSLVLWSFYLYHKTLSAVIISKSRTVQYIKTTYQYKA